ncbi:MAG: Methionine-R-sulfoxide reductase [candidate division WWE3 bacterium GW2011_GWC1_41_7]|uniref:Peptide methionine sulfoxide reductase MsrB n=4 Tax=Katanobacteria TaxID=422282 RepID=A0A0G0X3W8_UNCKA|nr:MAG: Methionine-R-sulfoxide reductase [candidate division WWE3 bacterium GW2011_GWB1_41_6]KKS19660.1 MAG: Methionine-R-sulfoxide reductase [candidate division WWE3 bacterium GW2011_GWC1_41_7]KKS21614.1 MAG: Methionine-R-sulfoxide reductase [candidate division WWE3 bacterium GW2011_GWA1_41_8]OGC58091.1 MAG: peptide-methionine (R)-S-oxide reductase [candidate division WWE3 bacterium RIFCSPLOWO2_01_FULL_41_9]
MQNLKHLSDNYWKGVLDPDQFNVLRQSGTELPFTGIYDDHYEEGVYNCAACGNELFSSREKYDAGCGWPTFWDSVNKENLEFVEDNSIGMKRIEVRCKNCGSHLGHVFDDGPEPTGIRYCVNSVSLDFSPGK